MPTPALPTSRGPASRRFGTERRGWLVAGILLMALLVLGAAPAQSIAAPSARPSVPTAPEQAADAPVEMELLRLDPQPLAPDGTLTAEVEVTNVSPAPIEDLALELHATSARVTDRAVLAAWESDTEPTVPGEPEAVTDAGEALAPQQSRTLRLEVAADDLGFSRAPEFWGTRRIAFTVTGDDQQLATVRTFLVWLPEDADASIASSVLLPLRAEDPGAVVADPAGYDESLRDGELADRARIAERADVDWLLDPALLDAPPLAERPEEGDQDGEPADTQPLGYSTSEEAARYASELGGGVGDRTVLALPYSSADLASLREADARGLEDIAEGRATSAFTSEGITPSGRAAVLPGAEADPDAVEARLATEPDVLLTPSTSLRPDPRGTITPSSVGVIEDSSGSTVVLAPDAPLSAELSALDADADVELVRQRVLAETAVIASEFTPTTRQILLMPDATADLDPEAVGAVLDALESAPWVETRSTADLLDAAASQSWTTNPQDQDDEALFALGRIDPASVQPSALDDEGYMTHLAEAERPAPLSPSMLQRLDDSISRAESLRGAMEDPAQVAGPEVLGLSATSIHWRDRPDEVTRRADAANTAIADLDEAISLSTSASFNLVANASEVPVTVSNQLDSRVTLELRASTDSHIVRVPEETITVEVPARSQTEALVPVEAIANGQVQLTVSVHGPDGVELAAPRDVELSVNPAWENWTTLVIVIAMGLLVVIGVLRARRHTSDRRAPAVRGPENTQAPARTRHDSSDRTDPDPR